MRSTSEGTVLELIVSRMIAPRMSVGQAAVRRLRGDEGRSWRHHEMGGQEFLDAMAHSKEVGPALALKAIKATAKGGTGKPRQRNRGRVPYYEPWPALGARRVR
ncbi:hypothetical protein ACF1A5_27845 [Streptomyces sp. NPDC014864]|uniref:hypothetical protein n=1 Tax=Streptomyces sp. NPDC014864 TaxID=3364924 RepID=UPI003701FE3B